MWFQSEQVDLDLFLYNPFGTLIASSAGAFTSHSITINLVNTGNYVVRVDPVSPDQNAYDLSLTGIAMCYGQAITVDIGAGQVPTNGNDVILGTAGGDIINAMDGDDIVCARGGADTVVGANGNDVVFGEAGNDLISGNSNNDVLFGGPGRDRAFGGSGDDTVYGGGGDNNVHGGPGDDFVARQRRNRHLRRWHRRHWRQRCRQLRNGAERPLIEGDVQYAPQYRPKWERPLPSGGDVA
ncbi:MAG: calcium-binding protein [Actinomycetota bacterium]